MATKEKKNIIILSNANGGIASYESNLIDFCSKKKISSIIFNTTMKNYNLKKYKFSKYKFLKTDLIWSPISSLNKILKLNEIKGEKYFIVSNTLIFTLYFLLIKFFIKNKKIFLIMHSHITNKKISQYIICFICTILSVFSDKIIFVSKFTCSWWLSKFPILKLSNYIIQYNLVPLEKSRIKKSSKNFNVGFVGRLEKEKNVKKFLDIAERTNKKNFIKFIVYGDGSQKNIVKKNKYINFQNWSNKKEFLKTVNLLLVTSPIENCPFSVLETKSHGIPTLNLADGGIKEIIEDNVDGINLKNKDYQSVLSCINYIKNNYAFFSKNCLKNSKKFNLDKMDYLFKT